MMWTLRGHRSHFEGAPTGQIWDDLSIKINNDSKDLEPIQKEATCPC